LSQILWADEEDLSRSQHLALYADALRELYERVDAMRARLIVVLYPSPMIDAQVQQMNIDFAREHD
jgi:hypothetical protein